MSIERLWTLVARKLAGEASANELDELSDLLAKNSDLHLQLEAIMTAWNGIPNQDKDEQEEAYAQLISKLRAQGYEMGNAEKEIPLGIEITRPRKGRLLKKWMIGSSLAFTIFLGIYFLWIKPGNPPTTVSKAQPANVISTKNGSRTKIDLPDGSTAWLNAGSKLTYDKQFGNNVREVELSGEAYFDVKHDETKPFIIRTSYLEIKDLGTQFNVKCYPDDKTSEVSVVEGSVEVNMKNRPQMKCVLMPNHKISVLNLPAMEPSALVQKKEKELTGSDSHMITFDTVNFDNNGEIREVAWTRNKLAFVNERLDMAAVKVERWFDRKVIVQTDLKFLQFTATFEPESLEQVLKALQLAAGMKFNFTIDAEKVVIY